MLEFKEEKISSNFFLLYRFVFLQCLLVERNQNTLGTVPIIFLFHML